MQLNRIAMKILFFFLPALFMLGVFGCKVGPNYQQPETELPESFLYDSLHADTVLNLVWWELFQDEQLNALIDIALIENKDVQIAAARVEQARAALGFTKADMWPTIGYQANYNITNTNPNTGETSDNSFDFFLGGANLSWEIDFWGKFRRANEAARAELVASEYGRRAVQVALISEVARAYFVLLENDVKLQTAVRTQKSRKESLNIIQERFNKGYTAEIDLNQSQIQEAIAAAAIPLYRRNAVQAENALNVLLGRFPGTITRGVTLYEQVIPPDIPAGLPSDLLLRRPDVQEVEKILIAQNARIGVAQALRFPSISLTGLLGAASPDLSGFSLAWSAGGGLLGPLFQFGKNKKRVEIERALYEQVLKEYELTVIQAFAEVENALIAVETLEDEFEARNRQVRAAENAKMLATERYNGGVTSYLEVLEQERQLFNAELEAATVRQLQLTAYVQLYKALGGGWITREEAAADQEAGE